MWVAPVGCVGSRSKCEQWGVRRRDGRRDEKGKRDWRIRGMQGGTLEVFGVALVHDEQRPPRR